MPLIRILYFLQLQSKLLSKRRLFQFFRHRVIHQPPLFYQVIFQLIATSYLLYSTSMKKSSQTSKIAQFVSQLEFQSKQRRASLKQQLLQQKRNLSKSFRQFDTSLKPDWSKNVRRSQCFEVQKYIPYKFIPKYKNESFIFPDRVLEKGNKRLMVKMKDTSINSFPIQNQSEKIKQVLKRQQKQQIIQNRKLLQLNRILQCNDGRIRSRRYRKMIDNRLIIKTPCGSDYFNEYPGGFKECHIPQKQLRDKISLSRAKQRNTWRPTSRTTKQFSELEGSDTFNSVLITRVRGSLNQFK